jgi:hypothetical protein
MLKRKQNLYKEVFNTETGKKVLKDLAKHCHADTPTRGERQEGMRDVWLYIQRTLKASMEDVAAYPNLEEQI